MTVATKTFLEISLTAEEMEVLKRAKSILKAVNEATNYSTFADEAEHNLSAFLTEDLDCGSSFLTE